MKILHSILAKLLYIYFHKSSSFEVKTKKKNWKLIFKELFEKPFFQILSIIAILITVVAGIISLIE